MLVLFAVMLPVILMFCGLAVDVGMLELKKMQMQTAADAAALGVELEWERGTGNQNAQGIADAAINGFTNGVSNVTVTIARPPSVGDFNARYDVQTVTISQTVNTRFMGALNGGKATVSVEASAMMPPCGYYTETAGISNAYTLNITNTVALPAQGVFSRCPVYIQKNIYQEATMGLDEYSINATGTAGQSSLNGSHYPTPTFGAANVPDPLASLPQPAASACNHTDFNITPTGWTTINPGTYCGDASNPGMTIHGGGVNFNPGLYVVTGGLHITGTTLAGSGVTMFFTKGSGVPYGQVVFDGVSEIDISAPNVTSGGSLATILFFTDRNWVHTSAHDFQLNDAEYYGSGVWYINGTGVQLTAKSSTYSPGYIALVTDSVYVDSSTLNLFSDFSMVTTGNPFRKQAVLVQ